jgi:hypothetical protein
MPIFIYHRINFLNQEIADEIFQKGVNGAPPADGIEFDVRSGDSELFICHDPFEKGQPFSEFIQYLPKDKLYIVNVKCERIEPLLIKELDEAGIHNFFLLDVGMPMLVSLAKKGERRIALRVSEYEALETANCVKGMVDWIWLDCFSKLPLTQTEENLLHSWGYKICLVSPELQGQEEKVALYKNYLEQEKISLDAICTKSYCVKKWL